MRASSRFAQWIERELSTMKPGDFFPPGRQLAVTWGLSERTVYEIMKSFARRGRIERITGKGSRVPVQPQCPGREESKRAVSEHTIVRTIKRDIFNGTLKSGDALPARKRFCLQFGVESKTVGKAYRQLVEENLVVNIGRRFWVGNFTELMKTGVSRDVVFFDGSGSGWERLLDDEIYGHLYLKIEHLITSKGFRIFYRDFESFESCMEHWFEKKEFPHALLLAGLRSHHKYRDFRKVDRVVRRYFGKRNIGRPPSIVIASPSATRKMTPLVKTLAGSHPTTIAREAARFIVRKHHRSATIFFNEEALGNRRFFDFVRLQPELLHLRDDFDLRFVVKTEDTPSRDSFTKRLQSHYPDTGFQYLRVCLDKYGPIPPHRALDAMSFVERFDRAFESQSTAGVWLFSTDADAVDALTWCERHKIRIPADRALLGFENNPRYLHHGITSVILDKETIGYNLAHALLDDIPVERTSQGYLRMQALVLERLTM